MTWLMFPRLAAGSVFGVPSSLLRVTASTRITASAASTASVAKTVVGLAPSVLALRLSDSVGGESLTVAPWSLSPIVGGGTRRLSLCRNACVAFYSGLRDSTTTDCAVHRCACGAGICGGCCTKRASKAHQRQLHCDCGADRRRAPGRLLQQAARASDLGVHKRAGGGEQLTGLEPGLEPGQNHRPTAEELIVGALAQLIVGDLQQARVLALVRSPT